MYMKSKLMQLLSQASFTNGIKKFVGIEPLIVGPGVKSGISVQLENPRNVGADRIADCAGAFNEYGGPILVADFGTATTYDYVDENLVRNLIKAVNE